MIFNSPKRIYADTSAATFTDRRVLDVISKISKNIYGNPSSIHTEGLAAEQILADARRQVAATFQGNADEIIFTSGGTEGNILAINGVINAWQKTSSAPAHIITSAVEHPSVIETVRAYQEKGGEATILPVDEKGFIDLSELEKNIKPNTALVSLFFANNEIGTINDLAEISKIIKKYRQKNNSIYPYFHTDACQAPRFLSIVAEPLGFDLATINSSKIYGPKGVGALFVKRKTKIDPIFYGGGQEFGLRSGTQNVAGLAGFAKALEICGQERAKEHYTLSNLRDELIENIKNEIGVSVLYGPTGDKRLPNNINIGFKDLDAEEIVIGLDVLGIAVSTGSACSSRESAQSHVLKALGQSSDVSSVRISLGRDCTKSDISKILNNLKKTTIRLSKNKNMLQ